MSDRLGLAGSAILASSLRVVALVGMAGTVDSQQLLRVVGLGKEFGVVILQVLNGGMLGRIELRFRRFSSFSSFRCFGGFRNLSGYCTVTSLSSTGISCTIIRFSRGTVGSQQLLRTLVRIHRKFGGQPTLGILLIQSQRGTEHGHYRCQHRQQHIEQHLQARQPRVTFIGQLQAQHHHR